MGFIDNDPPTSAIIPDSQAYHLIVLKSAANHLHKMLGLLACFVQTKVFCDDSITFVADYFCAIENLATTWVCDVYTSALVALNACSVDNYLACSTVHVYTSPESVVRNVCLIADANLTAHVMDVDTMPNIVMNTGHEQAEVLLHIWQLGHKTGLTVEKCERDISYFTMPHPDAYITPTKFSEDLDKPCTSLL